MYVQIDMVDNKGMFVLRIYKDNELYIINQDGDNICIGNRNGKGVLVKESDLFDAVNNLYQSKIKT